MDLIYWVAMVISTLLIIVQAHMIQRIRKTALMTVDLAEEQSKRAEELNKKLFNTRMELIEAKSEDAVVVNWVGLQPRGTSLVVRIDMDIRDNADAQACVLKSVRELLVRTQWTS